MVAFRAEVTTVETLAPKPQRCPLTLLAGSTTGSGQATHLGAVTLASSDCVLPPGVFMPSGVPAGVTCGNSLEGTFRFCDGRLTLTAANGDQLRAEYSGELRPPADPASPYTIAGSYRIVGGTGRFEDACGSGDLEGTMNLLTGQGEFRAIGGISY